MEVRMDLAQIVICETRDHQLIVLRERNGSRTLPIVIGLSEALAIDRRVKGMRLERPMTHDLLANVIEKLSAELERIGYTFLENDGTNPRSYFAQVGQILERRHMSIVGSSDKPQGKDEPNAVEAPQ